MPVVALNCKVAEEKVLRLAVVVATNTEAPAAETKTSDNTPITPRTPSPRCTALRAAKRTTRIPAFQILCGPAALGPRNLVRRRPTGLLADAPGER
ncbi:MAG: hypothetical protein ABSA14_15685, partial [Acidimicrobiales bacterium]